MPEPLTADRLAEIRKFAGKDGDGYACQTFQRAISDLLAELDRRESAGAVEEAGGAPTVDLTKPHWRCKCGAVAMPLTDDTLCNCKDIYEQEWRRIEPPAHAPDARAERLATIEADLREERDWGEWTHVADWLLAELRTADAEVKRLREYRAMARDTASAAEEDYE